MKVEINEVNKLAMFWLTNLEQKDAAFKEGLKPKFAAYKSQKYTVAVFQSGSENLPDMTAGLLLHNQKTAAKRDLEQESTQVFGSI